MLPAEIWVIDIGLASQPNLQAVASPGRYFYLEDAIELSTSGIGSGLVARICPQQAQPDPEDFCRLCTKYRHNQKDYYADPINCRWYYHCYLDQNGVQRAHHRPCAPGTYFREDIPGCVDLFKGGCDG